MVQPDPTVPWPPTGSATSNTMSAGTNDTANRAWTSDGPIAAFGPASDALAMAVSNHASGRAGGLNATAPVRNDKLNFTNPSWIAARRGGKCTLERRNPLGCGATDRS